MNLSRVFKRAHKAIKASGYTLDWSQCLKDSYAEERLIIAQREALVEMLKEGVVTLKFFKKSTGEEVERKATLNPAFTKYNNSRIKKANYNILFFDVEKGAPRSLIFDLFVGAVSFEPIKAAA